jgi:transposase
VKVVAPAVVTPYRKTGKNDDNDAEAIREAVARPNIRFVPVNTRDQQALLSLHRVRQGFVEERTALINRLRGLLAEFGFLFAQRHGALREIPPAAEGLPVLAKRAVGDLLDHLLQIFCAARSVASTASAEISRARTCITCRGRYPTPTWRLCAAAKRRQLRVAVHESYTIVHI